MKRACCLFILFACVFIPAASALDHIEILSGYLEAPLRDEDDYRVIPLLAAFNFEVKSFIEEKINIKIKGDIHLAVEPFLNTVFSPDGNIEIGANFLCKYTFPFSASIKPYIKGGLGVVYMSQHTREQSTQYNFLPQAGIGLYRFINPRTALSFEYRFRHLSNGSLERPNKGIDADLFLAGISFFF
ncbi:MAG: acyloxyacyl hydrolase [Candidatus Omnitrophota bacterium]